MLGNRILYAESPSRDAPPAPEGVTTLPQLFAYQAKASPFSPFITFSDDDSPSYTYGQALHRSSALANALASVASGVVGIWFEKSLDLHIAILTATQSGAAWLPFDPDAPADRVAICLEDSSSQAIICDEEHRDRAAQAVARMSTPCRVVTLRELEAIQCDCFASGPSPSDTAYIIYTSGSTGTPKGIAIPHSAALTFALSERSVLKTSSEDVVWQGFSPAFDMCVEEVIAGGAHLVVGSRAHCQDVSGLGGTDGIWAKFGVTVINAVPTLINIMTSLDGTLPERVRLLNLGGEACPPALVNRLWRPSLTIINTYGPTETTVTATYDILEPHQPVTIGKPLPSYHAVIMPIPDDHPGCEMIPMELTDGVEGQLCIGGPCLGKGYIRRPELTAEKYMQHPLFPDERLYQTGDRVRIDSKGRINFLGRIDTQVKHRGFRIELGEIESNLSSHNAVQVAAVICANAGEEDARLEAFIVLQEHDQDETETIRSLQDCLTTLPAYMRPEAYFFLDSDEMPRLPSGKINAKGLHDVSSRRSSASSAGAYSECSSPTSTVSSRTFVDNPSLKTLLSVMATVFPQPAKSGMLLPDADFFLDLGGHSLAAAILVSRLRKETKGSALESVTLSDIYQLRTAEAIAEKYADDGEPESPTDAVSGDDHWPVPKWRYVLCGVAQLPALLFFSFISATGFLGPYLLFSYVNSISNPGFALLCAYGIVVVLPLIFSVMGVIGKWVFLGKAKEGEYPLYGVYYYRWWIATRMVEMVDHRMGETGVYDFILRLLGAKVGTRCHMHPIQGGVALDLITIGDDCVISKDVTFNVSWVERGRLILKPVVLGNEVHVGSHSVLDGGSRMEDGAELGPMSTISDGTIVPKAQRWEGSPARYRCEAEAPFRGRSTRPSLIRFWLWNTAAILLGFVILPLLAAIPQAPGLMLFITVDLSPRGIVRWAQMAMLALPASLAYILALVLEIVIMRHLLGKFKEGTYRTTSVFMLRKWVLDRLMDMSLAVLSPIYATLYVIPYLRALGVKIGRRAEVSNARGMNVDLVEIGDESFVADNVKLGDAHVHGNALKLEKTTMACRAFAGNSALVPQGTHLRSNTLVGVLSLAPQDLPEGESSFGSPPVRMPRRQAAAVDHSAHLLFEPKRRQIAERLLIEGCRIWLPRAVIVFAIAYSLAIIDFAITQIGYYTLIMLPLVELVLFNIPSIIVVAICKWTMVRAYKPAEWPLWSRNVWYSEFVTAVYEAILSPGLLQRLLGTPFLAPILRLLGTKIGKRCTLLSHDITEWDMVTIGDEGVINHHAGPQTHLFEDRVMKIGPVNIESRAVMKPYSICLPGSSLGESSILGSLSLVMKGESIPAFERWQGSPTAPCKKPICDVEKQIV